MFVALKLVKVGVDQAIKRKGKKQEAQKFQQPNPNFAYPQPYQMGPYPTGVAPGVEVKYVVPEAPISKSAKIINMIMSIIRFCQLVFGLTVIGLYGTDVHHDHEDGYAANGKWVFAVVAAFLATMTAIIHMIVPFLKKGVSNSTNPKQLMPLFMWEFVLCVVWLALFGIFGKMYIGVYSTSDSSSSTSKRSASGRGGFQNDSSDDDTTDTSLGDMAKINRMRHAVWIDLVNLILWVITATWVFIRYMKNRKAVVAAAVFEGEKV